MSKLERTKTPGIYRRGNRYVVTFRDQQGTPRKRAAATLAEARDLKATLTADIRRGEYRPLSRVRFADYAREWVATYKGRTASGIRPETLSDYRFDLERDAIPFFGAMYLTAIEPRDVRRFADMIAARGVAPSTVRNALAPVRVLFATAYEDGLIRTNPVAGLRIAQRSPGHPERQTKALSEDELRAFLDALPSDWRLFFEFLAHTGLRIGEAVALTKADIDLTKKRVLVHRRLYRGRFDAPKSRYGRRSVPLTTGLANKLAQLTANTDDQAPLFPSKIGSHLDPAKVFSRVLKPAARKAGVPWAGFHTLRHTCATILFRHGLNAKQVQIWLGHHSPAFTLATYIHLISDDLPDAAFLDTLTAQRSRREKPSAGDEPRTSTSSTGKERLTSKTTKATDRATRHLYVIRRDAPKSPVHAACHSEEASSNPSSSSTA